MMMMLMMRMMMLMMRMMRRREEGGQEGGRRTLYTKKLTTPTEGWGNIGVQCWDLYIVVASLRFLKSPLDGLIKKGTSGNPLFN